MLVHTLRVTEARPERAVTRGREWSAAPGGPRGRLEPLDGVRFTVPEEPEGPWRGTRANGMGSASRRGAGRKDAAGERQPGRNGAGVGPGHG